MKAKQKNNISKTYLILVVALSMILSTVIVVADDETEIRITPATLNLADTEDKCVTVHTEISYYEDIVTDSWTLMADGGNVVATDTFSDKRGNLVVKFDRAEVADIVYVGEEVTLTLTGEMEDGTPFTGLGTIRVIE